jgi:nitrite reductase (NADH) small subunit
MKAIPEFKNRGSLYNLGSIEQIPVGEGRTFQLGDTEIAVFRARDGKVLATQALCPHRQGLLADGLTGNNKVVCPLHAYKFSLLTGQPVGNDCEALQTYAVSLNEAGEILLHWKQPSCIEGANFYEPSQQSESRAFRSATE